MRLQDVCVGAGGPAEGFNRDHRMAEGDDPVDANQTFARRLLLEEVEVRTQYARQLGEGAPPRLRRRLR